MPGRARMPRSRADVVADIYEAALDPDEWPRFAHPRRPEFLLTLPHVHGTSGFFIARLTTA